MVKGWETAYKEKPSLCFPWLPSAVWLPLSIEVTKLDQRRSEQLICADFEQETDKDDL